MNSRDDELQYERAVNEQYMNEVKRLVDEDNAVAREITASQRNSQWLGNSIRLGNGPLIRPFHGRVALDLHDPILGRGFYIGSYRADVDGQQVISYAAPMARLFYRPDDPSLDLGGHVLATRTFKSDTRSLTGFEDDLIRNDETTPFVRSSSTGIVERAPRPVVRPQRSTATGGRAATRPDAARHVSPAAPTPHVETNEARETPAEPSTERPAARGVARLLRAAKTVVDAVTAPRTGRLASLLATLQPDQYELVTWPEDEHLIVQGHPGTGKTVIAAHRAAWLTDPERLEPGRRTPKGSVLVIGPTREYADHVTPVLTDIARARCEVTSLSAFYARLGGFAPGIRPPSTERLATSADPLGRFVLECLDRYDGPADLASFTAALFTKRWKCTDPEVDSWLAEGGNFRRASQDPRFHPLLALIALRLNGVALADEVRHIVIDEAQDLRPIDVLILRQLCDHGVTFTLVGDMNQRHSDFTYASWTELAAAAHLQSDVEIVRRIDVGYRSTNQILRFAGGLLPKDQRTVEALREGPEPDVVKVRPERVVAEVIDRAVSLRERLDGLIAIITNDSRAIELALHAREWRKGSSSIHAWRPTSTSPEVLVFEPTFARGLEFDGVVVQEPGSFPQDLGRHGVLYTSLTRATHELVVVHSQPLPRGLKRR